VAMKGYRQASYKTLSRAAIPRQPKRACFWVDEDVTAVEAPV
jgi:hypothetical protein